MKMKLFHVYTDPGHGWLKTTMQILREFGVSGKISPCSHRRGDNVWLEEDCDAPLLVNAMKKQGIDIKFAEHNRNSESPIRDYPPYQP